MSPTLGAAGYGKPLDGVRILAVEQMQALPWATQLLARLGAEVVKVEPPGAGESGRGALPAMADPQGRAVGATFLRNNLNKRSIAIDLTHRRGAGPVPRPRAPFRRRRRELQVRRHRVASGSATSVSPPGIRRWCTCRCRASATSSSRRTRRGRRTRRWPRRCRASTTTARTPGSPPVVAPVGALGDIGAGLFAVVGMLAALRHRDRTGEGQYVDVAMYDAMVAITDVVTAFWSLGSPATGRAPQLVMHTFRAADGWFVMQVARPHQFERLAALVGRPEWLDDERLADAVGLGRPHRRPHPPRGRGVGRRPGQDRALRRAGRRRHRRRAVPHRRRGGRRPPRRRPRHAGRGPPHRRHRAAAAGARAIR